MESKLTLIRSPDEFKFFSDLVNVGEDACEAPSIEFCDGYQNRMLIYGFDRR
jgi:hypothetical protein